MADGSGRHEPEEDASVGGASVEGAEAAERAFAALRAEVAGLGRQLDALARQGEGGGAVAPDYSLTLGAMEKELRALGTRLDGMAVHPALRLTPAEYGRQTKTGVQEVANAAERSLDRAQDRLRDAEKELRGLVGVVREKREQRRLEIVAVALCVVSGMFLWPALIRVLPWSAGSWMTALPVSGERWSAGAALMREDDPWAWERMARLFKACPRDSGTDLCEAAMAVRTIPPGIPAQPAPEGAKAPAPGTAPSPPRGKGGH